MNPLAGASTDPTPYIAAAYLLGAVGMVGFAGWLVAERQRLRRLLVAVQQDDPSATARSSRKA